MTCDVCAEPNLVVTCDVYLGGAFSGLGSATPILHIFGNNERTDNWNLLSFGVSCYFVASKLIGRYWDLKQRLKAKILN